MGEFERGVTIVLILVGVLILLGYKSSAKGAGQGNKLGRKATTVLSASETEALCCIMLWFFWLSR